MKTENWTWLRSGVDSTSCSRNRELNDADWQLTLWFLFWFNIACSQCLFSSSSVLFIEFTSVLTVDFGRRRVFVLPAAAAPHLRAAALPPSCVTVVPFVCVCLEIVFHLREAFWFLLTVVSCLMWINTENGALVDSAPFWYTAGCLFHLLSAGKGVWWEWWGSFQV